MSNLNNSYTADTPLISDGQIDLYMVVGQDTVTNWLGEGWELYGSPMWDSNSGWGRQAIIKRRLKALNQTNYEREDSDE